MLHLDRRSEHVIVVTLDRPDRTNAIDGETLFVTLPALFEELAIDRTLRAIVLTGAGTSFCAGADLSDPMFSETDPVVIASNDIRANRTLVTIRNMPQPVIAAVNGAAVGFGLGLAVACDLRTVSTTARFGAPFTTFGLVPDSGLTYTLPSLIGVGAAADLLFTGRMLDAQEAVTLGIARDISDDCVSDAVKLAHQIASNPPTAIAATKRLLLDRVHGDLTHALLENEPPIVAAAIAGDEYRNSFKAYRGTVGRQHRQ